jgi:ATP-dependent helicase HrpA
VPSVEILTTLAKSLSACMIADRHRLQQRLHKLDYSATADAISQLQQDIDRSAERASQRLAQLPTPVYPEALPVVERREDILAAIANHQVVILCGETGSGKTTQIPKICLELKRGVRGLIGCTQPRRIAARSVASRLSRELESSLGHTVGFKVRFQDKLSEHTYIKVMTDGILLAETQGDRFLDAYDTIIIDEAHERSLNIDFLLGYLKQLLPKRPDLKVIVTSATIDADRFSRHFNNAPVIEVSGRLYPVEVRYRAIEAKDEDAQDDALQAAIQDATDELARLGPHGDILIFLPGEREIRDTAEALRKHHPPHTEILPLYARLSAEEQERVFKLGVGRRIVLATNVAETSLTVPGIRYVIDPGYARVNRYSYRNKVEQLLTEKISQASANQRSGRCGRVAAGVCIRLYDENDFTARPRFTDPEILRSSLAGVILRMQALKLGDVENFPFIDSPTPRMIADGYQLLAELNAVDSERRLTDIGKQLARLPIDPRIGRMILAAQNENCLNEVLIIAAALSVDDPRMRPAEATGRADEKHRHFQDERSDFMGFLKLWEFFEDALKHKKSNRKLIELCHDNFLSHVRLREWREIHSQLVSLVAEMGMRQNKSSLTPSPLPVGSEGGHVPLRGDAFYESIHCALLTGLLGNIGVKAEEGHYQGAREVKFQIFPGSALHKKNSKWVVAAELTETTKLYARAVAKIEPEWVERVGGHLIKSSYFDPHWEKAPAQVVAFERLTLYGLIINPKRRVHYGPIEPKLSREIFIRHALVAGEFNSRAPFFAHNQKLVEDIRELEHKSRRQDVLVDEDRMFSFFDVRIPQVIFNGAAFDKWRKDAEKNNPRLLFMVRDDLMRHGAEAITEELFPETLKVGEATCNLNYRFEPNHPLDGVTLTLPLHLLNLLDEARCEWLVPGMLREKITWLVKALPKRMRSLCVPVPEFVTAALIEFSSPPSQPLTETLGNFIRKKTGQSIAADEWNLSDLPLHFKMNFRVVDDAWQELAMSRDITELRQKLGQAAQVTFARAPELDFERENLTQWDCGDLPEKITFNRGGAQLIGYPALTDEDGQVNLRLFDTAEAATAAMRAGVRRLLRLVLREQMKQVEKNLPGFTQLALQSRGIMNPDELRDDLLDCITDRAFIGDDELPRNAKSFATQKDRARTRLPAVSDAACRLAASLFADYLAIQAKLSTKLPYPLASDIREQLSRLIYKGFLSATPWEQLQHFPRYLKAILRRLEKYAGNAERDGRWTSTVREFWQNYEARLEKSRKAKSSTLELEKFRWMIEELRVSLFAQELKTPYPVSVKRMQKAWEELKKI